MALVWLSHESAYAHNFFSRASAPVIVLFFPFFFLLSILNIWIPAKHSEESYQLLDILENSRSTPFNWIFWEFGLYPTLIVQVLCNCKETHQIVSVWKRQSYEKWVHRKTNTETSLFPFSSNSFMPLQPSKVHPCVHMHRNRHFSLTLKYLTSFLLHFVLFLTLHWNFNSSSRPCS